MVSLGSALQDRRLRMMAGKFALIGGWYLVPMLWLRKFGVECWALKFFMIWLLAAGNFNVEKLVLPPGIELGSTV